MEEYNELMNNLETLRLHKMKENLKEEMNRYKLDNVELVRMMNRLTKLEILSRDQRAKEVNVKMSGFPYVKTISSFDFDFQPSINKNEIMDLMTLRFIEKAENIIFVGLPGTGKTMLSTCIGVHAASNRVSTHFVNCNALLTDLKKAKHENKLDERLKQYTKYKLLILDEFGFLPLNKDDANLIFQLIAMRYEKKPTIVTTNITFSRWGEALGDPVIAAAILDRLLHHSHVIQIDGPSYRTKDILKDS